MHHAISSELSEIYVDRLEHTRVRVLDDDELLAATNPAEHDVQQAERTSMMMSS